MGFIPERSVGLPAGANRNNKRAHPEEYSSSVQQSRQRLSDTPPSSQQSVVPDSTPTTNTTVTFKYPIGFPSPPIWLESYFEDWAARWRGAHGARPVSIELRQVLEQFVADISTSARILEIAKYNVEYVRDLVEGVQDIQTGYNARLEGTIEGMSGERQRDNGTRKISQTHVNFLRASIDVINMAIYQNESRLEEAQLSLDQAQAEHTAYMALNTHIYTVQDVERVLTQQCNLERIAVGQVA
ncbi:hypothetical protein GGH13_000424 [Coemansia sp. S155-1]|nr:hypothetical protein H4S03_000320 [Coemansia sp. S3946]KAJ2075710.1 hypothetical protein GGH13_000424 [Coemansia sp. S155-1]